MYSIVIRQSYTLQSNPLDISSIHLALYIVTTTLFIIFFMLYFISLWLFYSYNFVLFKRSYLFIFRQSGREGEREGKKHRCVRDGLPLSHPQLGTWPVTQACALMNWTSDFLVHRLALNPLSHTWDQFVLLKPFTFFIQLPNTRPLWQQIFLECLWYGRK